MCLLGNEKSCHPKKDRAPSCKKLKGYCTDVSSDCKKGFTSMDDGCKSDSCKCCYEGCSDYGCADAGGLIVESKHECDENQEVNYDLVMGPKNCACCLDIETTTMPYTSTMYSSTMYSSTMDSTTQESTTNPTSA